MSLLHIWPPFSYYCQHTAQGWSLRGACTQVFSSALQDLPPSRSLQALNWKHRFPMLCAGRSSHLQRGSHERNAQESFRHHLNRTRQRWTFLLQDSYLLTLFPEVIIAQMKRCGIETRSWVDAEVHWKWLRWPREELSSFLCITGSKGSRSSSRWRGPVAMGNVSLPLHWEDIPLPWDLWLLRT